MLNILMSYFNIISVSDFKPNGKIIKNPGAKITSGLYHKKTKKIIVLVIIYIIYVYACKRTGNHTPV